MNHIRCVSPIWPPSGQLLYMPMIVTNGVFVVQNTFGCVIVRRGASRLSGLMVADWAQKLRTKAWRLVSPVTGGARRWTAILGRWPADHEVPPTVQVEPACWLVETRLHG
jgi:hypothetical protein